MNKLIKGLSSVWLELKSGPPCQSLQQHTCNEFQAKHRKFLLLDLLEVEVPADINNRWNLKYLIGTKKHSKHHGSAQIQEQ